MNKSKLRIERKLSQHKDPLTAKAINTEVLEDFSTKIKDVTNEVQYSKTKRVRCLRKFSVQEPKYKVIKYSKQNKENVR